MVIMANPDQKCFVKCPKVPTFFSKVGKILPVKRNFFCGPKKFFAYYFLNLKFCPKLARHMPFLLHFWQNGRVFTTKWVHACMMQLGACSKGHVFYWGWGGLKF